MKPERVRYRLQRSQSPEEMIGLASVILSFKEFKRMLLKIGSYVNEFAPCKGSKQLLRLLECFSENDDPEEVIRKANSLTGKQEAVAVMSDLAEAIVKKSRREHYGAVHRIPRRIAEAYAATVCKDGCDEDEYIVEFLRAKDLTLNFLRSHVNLKA